MSVTDIYLPCMAIFIEYVMIKFYNYRRKLPIMKNRIFERMLKIIFFSSIVNLISIIIHLYSRGNPMPNEINYISDFLYLIISEIAYIIIIFYIFSCIYKKDMFKYLKEIQIILFVPIMLTILYALNNRDVFYTNRIGNYYQGKYFFIVNLYPFIVFLFLSFNSIFSEKDQYLENKKYILYATIVLLVGMVVMTKTKIFVSLDSFFCISVIILYISIENPEFYITENLKTYNSKGFIDFVDERLMRNKKINIFGIYIENFESLRTRYGMENLYIGLRLLKDWLNETFQNQYVFNINARCFNIVSENDIDIEEISKIISDRLKEPFSGENMEFFFWGKVFNFDEDILKSYDASKIIDANNYAVSNCFIGNEKFCIDKAVFEKVENEKKIQNIIQECIDKKDIEIYIQPIYNTIIKKIEGGEVLVRIYREEYGLIMPGEFIGIAEKSTKIMELGYIIFEKTCEYIANIDMESIGIEFINVNISPFQFQDGNLVVNLKKIADKYNVDFSIFDFEITESAVKSEKLMEKHINKFKEFNSTLSIDDFGSGSSNISRLTDYDFNIAKIDMSLVWSYFDGENTIMKDIINIFKSENLKIVAEGVETEEMVYKLSEMGCEYLQGYYFSKPVPVVDFIKYTKDFNFRENYPI